ncbi:MAG: M14 family zinc carboxypeptidase, partial [Myxococcota bacterium]
ELNSGFMAMSAMERLASGYGTDPAITKLLDERDVYIVPVVNPDGVRAVWSEQRMWRKNRAANADGTTGVDVNRNYPFLFGACGSSGSGSSEVFRGPSAGSEPEVRTMMALQRAVRPELYVDFHSYGNEVLSLYPPCATVTPEMKAMGKRYADQLRAPMGFATRAPSGSGEAPHWYWSQGTLSYLVEVGNAFQPRFEDTVRDEQKVWAGLKEALTTWAPAARGRVTDSAGTPLVATFTVQQPIFRHGETLSSRAGDGAFSLWLPVGTWDVVVSAEGYAPKTVRVTVETYDQTQALDVRLEPAGTRPIAAR